MQLWKTGLISSESIWVPSKQTEILNTDFAAYPRVLPKVSYILNVQNKT